MLTLSRPCLLRLALAKKPNEIPVQPNPSALPTDYYLVPTNDNSSSKIDQKTLRNSLISTTNHVTNPELLSTFYKSSIRSAEKASMPTTKSDNDQDSRFKDNFSLIDATRLFMMEQNDSPFWALDSEKLKAIQLDYFLKLKAVNWPAVPDFPELSTKIVEKQDLDLLEHLSKKDAINVYKTMEKNLKIIEKYELEKFSITEVSDNISDVSFAFRRNYRTPELRRKSKHRIYSTYQKKQNLTGFFEGHVSIIDEIRQVTSGKKTEPYDDDEKDSLRVFINSDRIVKDEYLKFTYVSLRTILSEIFARDENFLPDFMNSPHKFFPPSKNPSTKFELDDLIKYAIESTYKTRITQRTIKKDPLEFQQHHDFLFTQFDDKLREQRMKNIEKSDKSSNNFSSNMKSGPVKVFAYPSRFSSNKQRLEKYLDCLLESQNGYLVILDYPENAHLIQEARAFVLSKGKFYDQIFDSNRKLIGESENDDNSIFPNAWTFAPCPHDQPCPSRIPCTFTSQYVTTTVNALSGGPRSAQTNKSIKYSYVVFKVGQERTKELLETYVSEKKRQIKAGGKQYAQILTDSKEIKNLLPWPRLLSKGWRAKNHEASYLKNVKICMPDGTLFDANNVADDTKYNSGKAHLIKRKVSDRTTAMSEIGIGSQFFHLIKMSRPGFRLPSFSFQSYIEKFNHSNDDNDKLRDQG